jgi:hypothetical protein
MKIRGESNAMPTPDEGENAAPVPSFKFSLINHFLCSNMMTVVDNFQFYVHVTVDWLEHPGKS